MSSYVHKGKVIYIWIFPDPAYARPTLGGAATVVVVPIRAIEKELK